MTDDARALLAPLRDAGPDVRALPSYPLIATGRRRLARRRVARLTGSMALAATAAFTLAGVAGHERGPATLISPAAAPANGTVLPHPDPDDPIIAGATYRYRLYGHCGIDWVYLGGRWWRAETPLRDDAVPEFLPGTMWVGRDAGVAVFTDDAGTEIRFVPVNGEPEWGCA